ncbi:MAG: hypothetical protein D6705_04920 [Deltaproteobacteria bacterium]|nr:MAG: hypothetical protein D6705_04920 [Deltaproteobacteria bacterium]
MDPVTQFLVLVAGLFLLGTLGEVIFARTQIPDVVWLIVAGIILGPIAGVVPRQSLVDITPYFAALTLIIVLFEGGSRLVLDDLLRAAPRASLLAIASFTLTTFVVAGVSMIFGVFEVLPDWSFAKGIMLGAILGGSSSLIVMPSMSLAKVKESVANLVNLESALTDALCVVVTLAMVDVVVSGAASFGQTALVLLRSFGIAFAVGVLAGWAWLPVLRLLAGSPHVYPLTLSALILLYVAVDAAGGSAALGILTFAVIVGNAPAILARIGFASKERPVELDMQVRAAHTQISFIVKSFFFTFIGLMLSPPWGLLALGVFLGIVMLGARIPAVFVATRGTHYSRGELELVTVSFPRGMAAGVLATIPAYAGVPGTDELPSVVFAAVITTILLFAGLFPRAKKRATADEARGAASGAAATTDASASGSAAAGAEPGGDEVRQDGAAASPSDPSPPALPAESPTGTPPPDDGVVATGASDAPAAQAPPAASGPVTPPPADPADS